MKGIATRRQVIVAAHSVLRGPLERLYDTGFGRSRGWAITTSSPRPVNLPAPQSSPMGIVPWPLIFVLGIFALLTVLQQLLRDNEGGRQVQEQKEKPIKLDAHEEDQAFSFAAHGIRARCFGQQTSCKPMDVPTENQTNIGLTILRRPENASEAIIMNWEQDKGRNGILLCCEKEHELKPGFYESTEWDSKAWEHVRVLLRDRLRRRFCLSSFNSMFVHKTLPDLEDCSSSQALLKFSTHDKDREIYAICERVVALLEPYGELMGQDLRVHPYQGRLIPWKSIEVVSTELRNLYHACVHDAYGPERSFAENERSDLFIEDMAVKLAGEVKRAVFEVGFYSYSSNSLPPTSRAS